MLSFSIYLDDVVYWRFSMTHEELNLCKISLKNMLMASDKSVCNGLFGNLFYEKWDSRILY